MQYSRQHICTTKIPLFDRNSPSYIFIFCLHCNNITLPKFKWGVPNILASELQIWQYGMEHCYQLKRNALTWANYFYQVGEFLSTLKVTHRFLTRAIDRYLVFLLDSISSIFSTRPLMFGLLDGSFTARVGGMMEQPHHNQQIILKRIVRILAFCTLAVRGCRSFVTSKSDADLTQDSVDY